MKEFRGTGASEGYASGPAFVFCRKPVPAGPVKDRQVPPEKAMEEFFRGREILRVQLIRMASEAEQKYGSGNAGIYEGYAEIIMDDEIENRVRELISEGYNAAEASKNALAEQARELEALDGYMKERGPELADLGSRLYAAVSGSGISFAPELTEPCILLSDELGPFDTIHLDHDLILGLAMDKGAYTSHVAILARSLCIPCVTGLGSASSEVRDGTICALDGSSGVFITEPDREILAAYSLNEKARRQRQIDFLINAAEPARTRDGTVIQVCANIGSPEEAEKAVSFGAGGAGLFRTEFIYMDANRLPSEEEQFLIYRKTLSALDGRPLTIRTLDIGGDKPHPALGLEKEDNPFLGYRGIRLSLDRPDIFKPQLRAILRAAYFGNTEIMFPMIAALDELRRARSVLDECRRELAAESMNAGNLPVGIMIETPAAALMAGEFAAISDFFSLGTNDLTQYTLAAERGNRRLAGLHDPLNPAVLRLMSLACAAAREAEIPVSICGELAADPKAIPVLLGMGISRLSVPVSKIPGVKDEIKKLDFKVCQNKYRDRWF